MYWREYHKVYLCEWGWSTNSILPYCYGTPNGVWDDLHGFVNFVKYVEVVKSKKNPQKPRDFFNLKTF